MHFSTMKVQRLCLCLLVLLFSLEGSTMLWGMVKSRHPRTPCEVLRKLTHDAFATLAIMATPFLLDPQVTMSMILG